MYSIRAGPSKFSLKEDLVYPSGAQEVNKRDVEKVTSILALTLVVLIMISTGFRGFN
jgi:hypothetical protein